MQTGGGQPDPSLPLTRTEEKIAAIIGSESITVISGGGGDADRLAATLERNGNYQPTTSLVLTQKTRLANLLRCTLLLLR